MTGRAALNPEEIPDHDATAVTADADGRRTTSGGIFREPQPDHHVAQAARPSVNRRRHGVGLTDTERARLTAAAASAMAPSHQVGMTDAQRAALIAMVDAAPLPPPEAISRLRGYLPPVTRG